MEKHNHFLVFRENAIDLSKLKNSSLYKNSIYISHQTHMPKDGVSCIVSDLSDYMSYVVPRLEILNYVDQVSIVYVPNESMLSPVALICESSFDLIKVSEKDLIVFLDLCKEYYYLQKISHYLCDIEAYSEAYEDKVQNSNLPENFDYEKIVGEQINAIRQKTDQATDILQEKILDLMILN